MSAHARLLAQGNQALREGDCERAITLYAQALERYPELGSIIRANLRLAHRRQRGRVQGVASAESLERHARHLPPCLFRRKLSEIRLPEEPPQLAAAIRAAERAITERRRSIASLVEPPLVSVIMPTYNRADIIAESITTVIEQRYRQWELWVCDDGSTDHTERVVARLGDARIHYLKLPKGGAAAARNQGLRRARGSLIAYLDSDNYWHPEYLTTVVALLLEQSGRSSVCVDDIDYWVDARGEHRLMGFQRPVFGHERLLDKPFVDLNSFAHRRELYICFGGFNEQLKRRQDYDLILKYTWLRDPLHFSHPLNLYHRNDSLDQITTLHSQDAACRNIIRKAVKGYFRAGLPIRRPSPVRRVTVLSWDLCRNHFSKPFALAEALSEDYEVQLLSFRFFDEGLFAPLREAEPVFKTFYLPGGTFPEFFERMDEALAAIRGEVIYVVKPRLPSLGLALLANRRSGVPIVLEVNDLETVAQAPRTDGQHVALALEDVDWTDPELLNPYSERWSQLLDPLARALPVTVTHNRGLDAHFGHRCLYLRNIKDERVYDPGRYHRAGIRAELGFGLEDRVILFGGLLREHKGIFELVELLGHLDDPRYKLLFVASRSSPDQARLACAHGERVRLLPAQDRAAMARINLAADLVILWLNPAVSASHYQMPYKATDALAMGTPIIANDISDLGELGRQGYLRLVPFGDWAGMCEAIERLFADPEGTERLRQAGRRLFLRQFSYAAARGSFALALQRALSEASGVLSVAERFGRYYDAFRRERGERQ